MSPRLLLVCSAVLLSASGVFADGAYQRTKNGKTIVWNSDPKPGDTATWFGDRDRDGYATKMGTLTWYTANGTVYARYLGNTVRGKFNGMVVAHSQGKTGHAMFVDGQRTTSWAAGPAPSWRVADLRAGPPVKAVSAPEVPAEKPPVVRETENEPTRKGQGARIGAASPASGGHGESVPATGPIRSGRPREANVQPATPETFRGRPVNGQASNPPVRWTGPTPASTQRPTPNSESVLEQLAPTPIEEAPAKELSLQQAPPAQPAVTPGPASAAPSFAAEPDAPAEGPRVDPSKSVQPPLRAAVPPRPEAPRVPNDTAGDAPHSETFPEQAPQPTVEETPSIVMQPSKESVPTPPTSEKSQAEIEDSLQSLVEPPSRLAEDPETAASRETGARLTKHEVIRIATAAARARGYNRADYYMAEPQYNPGYQVWSVSWGQRTADGMEEASKRFNIVVDDKTKGTVFELSK